MSEQLHKKFSVEVPMANKYMKKMLTILSYHENANHIEIALPAGQNGYHQDHKHHQMLGEMQEEMDHLYTADENVNRTQRIPLFTLLRILQSPSLR